MYILLLYARAAVVLLLIIHAHNEVARMNIVGIIRTMIYEHI